MFRKVINAVVRATGWKLVGKRLFFCEGEGPASTQLEGQYGKVTGVHKDTSQRVPQDVILVELQHTSTGTRKIQEVLLVPRHKGFGIEALATTFISVYVFPRDDEKLVVPAQKESMVALMDVRVAKDV